MNANETFLLFHPFGENLIAPRVVKRVGTAMQVDNEKFGATVMIACEFRTSSILPPMIIFTGVHCAKLMTDWCSYPKGMFIVLLMNNIFSNPTALSLFLAKVIFKKSKWMNSNAAIIYISYQQSIFRA